MSDNLKIDYVELPTGNFDLVQAFYESVFGWKFTDYGPEYRAFHDGKTEGGFYLSELRSSTETGAALVIIYAENLEGMRDAVVANGGTIVRDIISFPGA